MTGKKVLIVDDDTDILDVVTMILESHSYEVIVAHDGIECLDKIKTEKPELLILDLLMPKMDGFAVYKELKSTEWSEYHNIPIIILTSVREEASRRRYELETGERLSPDSYLEKPLIPDVLIAKVEKVLKYK